MDMCTFAGWQEGKVLGEGFYSHKDQGNVKGYTPDSESEMRESKCTEGHLRF